MKKYLWIILFVLVLSCQDKIAHQYAIISTWNEVEISSQPLTDFDECIGIFGIYSIGDYYLLYQYKQDYFFKVYDKDYNLLGELCKRGDGPDEFVTVSCFGQYDIVDDETKVWLLDPAKKLFVKVNIEKSFANEMLVIDEKFDLKSVNEINPRNLFYINENKLIGTDDKMDCKVFVVDPITYKTTFFEHTPSFPETNYTHDISQNMAALKPDGTRMASMFFSIPQIDLINADGETYFSLFFEEIVEPEKIELNKLHTLESFLQVVTTDKHIFVLSEVVEENEKQALFVMDWEGNPCFKTYVDSATFFCIRNNSEIYCLDFNSEIEIVKRYDVSAYL